MSQARFFIMDGDNMRKSYLWVDCSFNGGNWAQTPFEGQPQMVLPVSNGIWKKEEVSGGRAGKMGDKIVLYHANDRVASFWFEEFKHGNKFKGKYVAREDYPSTQGDLFWKDFDANTLVAPNPTKTFSIRSAGGLSLGFGVAGKDYLQFEITDLSTNQSALYFYDGIGISIGIKGVPKQIPGHGLSTKGPANEFTSHGWRTVRDFEGSGASGGASLNLSTSTGFNWFVFSDITITPFNGGDGYSLPSIGHTQGTFKLVSSQ